MLTIVFFMFVFGVIEMARVIFTYNVLQEVTRRAASAAAKVYPGDAAAMSALRQAAVFRSSPGGLVLVPSVTDEHVRIDYLSLARNSNGSFSMLEVAEASLPNCPAQNKHNCMLDPNGENCIRFVRARICDPANTGACDPVTASRIVPLVDLTFDLTRATTITPAESLGYSPGMVPCP